MRCLKCDLDGLPLDTENCPNPDCGASISSQIHGMLPRGTLLHNGRYRIDFPLARGGFGITYRAFHFDLDKVVVIKEFFPKEQVMRPDNTCLVFVDKAEQANYNKAINHFLKEARILARLRADNVVRVYDCFVDYNTAYIVMEMIDGCTLRKLLKERPEPHCFPPDEVERIIDQMVNALEAIHLHDIFHLDISPDNVMQTKSGKIVLIDFGAARHSIRTSGSGGALHQFKYAYAPKEVVAGTRVGPQSDLFELAMMAHELLIGQAPPTYLQREATDDKWEPQLSDERWQRALARALHLKQEMRPSSVRGWWDSFHKGIIFGDRKEPE